MNTIEIKGIKKSYGKLTVLENINLKLTEGMFGLLGPNGAGKTTLMKIICTTLAPDSGNVLINGRDALKNPVLIRERLGYLPQDFNGIDSLKGYEFLEYIAILKGITDNKTRKEEINRVLNLTNMLEYKNRKIGKYSGGMKRRIGIAQALLNDPEILVVDEPTAGLDPEERIKFRNILRKLSLGKIVIISTHIVEDIMATCQSVGVLKKGKLKVFYKLSDLAKEAEGKVWNLEEKTNKFHEIENRYRIISTLAAENPENTVFRIMSDEKPEGGAKPVEPTIEEGYLKCIETPE